MKKILLAFTITVVFTACGKSSTDSDSPTDVSSTTPPSTIDSTNPIGVMMGDTANTVSDSLNSQK
jgi:ABC-type oligopeptide transport system substrate-binding subunit